MRGFKRARSHGIAALVSLGAACVHPAPSKDPPICVTVPVEQPEPPPPRRASPELPPLESESPLVDLPVPGYLDAVVSLPMGATSRRPLVVAAHGAGDRPDWQCRFWRDIVGDRAFVLCPRGDPSNPQAPPDQRGYFHASHVALGGEIEGAIAALAGRFRAHVDVAAPVFAGFSQGAIMGALLLPHHPARFSRAVLVEGGAGTFQEWNRHAARRFRERGGARVLFACGRAECADAATVSEGHLRREGVTAQVAYAPGAGHTYGGDVGLEVARAFPWLLEGDERFAAGMQ